MVKKKKKKRVVIDAVILLSIQEYRSETFMY